MKRIMFVCHGNICRSPMAELVMRRLIEERGLSHKYEVASSATSTEELGSPVYPPAREELARHGISSAGKRAVQLSRSDADKYDMLIGMDSANIRNMHRILGEGARGKIYKMMSFAGSDADVADPWYYGGFDRTYREISRAAEALIDMLEREQN